jgi:ADP-L-glycero-D-manno-heptose 6-epimerase
MIVLTGGAGFIGSNIARALNARGIDDILIVDRLLDGSKHLNLTGVRFADYVDHDDFIGDPAAFGHVDAVFHQGACTNTTEKDGRFMMRNNYDYSKGLLRYCAGSGIPLVYASSAAVYGRGSQGFREHPDCEQPLNVYAFSKLVFDNYVRRHAPSFKSPVVGLRYFNVYGPREQHKGDMASVPYKMVMQHAHGQPIKLFEGSEDFKRDFIHVDDVVKLNLYFAERPCSGIFNCGTGQAHSFAELGQIVARTLPEAAVETIPMPETLRHQYQTFTCSNNDSLRHAGYADGFVPFVVGLTSYVEWLRRRP